MGSFRKVGKRTQVYVWELTSVNSSEITVRELAYLSEREPNVDHLEALVKRYHTLARLEEWSLEKKEREGESADLVFDVRASLPGTLRIFGKGSLDKNVSRIGDEKYAAGRRGDPVRRKKMPLYSSIFDLLVETEFDTLETTYKATA